MPKTIQQKVRFKATPQALFELYMDSKKHTSATGAKARIGRRIGGKFSAFGGVLKGVMLQVIRNRLIVQSWRSSQFRAGDMDSTLILAFEKAPGGARISLVHVNVPEHDYLGVKNGWPRYYWRPWKAYLRRNQS